MPRQTHVREPLQKHSTTPLAEIRGFSKVQSITGAATMDSDADLVVSTGAGARALTLPSLATAVIGQRYTVKQVSAGVVTITAAGSDTIDGGASVVTTGAYTQVSFSAVKHGSTVEWMTV